MDAYKSILWNAAMIAEQKEAEDRMRELPQPTDERTSSFGALPQIQDQQQREKEKADAQTQMAIMQLNSKMDRIQNDIYTLAQAIKELGRAMNAAVSELRAEIRGNK